jgi:hypothetical protein
MATGQGSSVINFGAFPGAQEASVSFTDAAIGGASKVEAYVMGGDSTADHSTTDHRYLAALPVSFTAVPNAGVGGTIHARALMKLVGTFQLRYVWAD